MTIVVSYVPTQEGFVALGAAIDEARWRQTSVTVINVLVGLDASVSTFADEKDLDAVRARLDELEIVNDVRQISSETDVADAILAVAQDKHAELIVVGLRRKSPLAKALLGSSAERIMLLATCPVLAVRPVPS
jgi:nucleotide-binding universal stress UspA family protein